VALTPLAPSLARPLPVMVEGKNIQTKKIKATILKVNLFDHISILAQDVIKLICCSYNKSSFCGVGASPSTFQQQQNAYQEVGQMRRTPIQSAGISRFCYCARYFVLFIFHSFVRSFIHLIIFSTFTLI